MQSICQILVGVDKPNQGPGRSNRKGISKVQLSEKIPDEAAA